MQAGKEEKKTSSSDKPSPRISAEKVEGELAVVNVTPDHVDGLRDHEGTRGVPEDRGRQTPSLDSVSSSIKDLTKSLKSMQDNQEDLVNVMMAAGGKPFFGKGKGVGKRSAPRAEDTTPRGPKVTAMEPPHAKRAKMHEMSDSELDYSDNSEDELAFTSDDIENQIDNFLNTARYDPPSRPRKPQPPPAVPGPSGSQVQAPVTLTVSDTEEDVRDESLAGFAQDLTTDEDVGPDLNGQLAEIMTNLLGKKLSDEKIKTRVEEYPPPRNVPLLHPPRVNECIWELLKAGPRSADIRMRKIQVRVTRGLVALARLAEVILTHKKRGTAPDLADCLNKLLQSVALIANGNYEISLRRRETLRSQLNPQYSRLCYPSTPVTTDLFGDDVTKLVEDITKVNRLSSSIGQSYRKQYGNNNSNNNRGFNSRNQGGRGRGGYNKGQRRGGNNQSKNSKWRGNGQRKTGNNQQ